MGSLWLYWPELEHQHGEEVTEVGSVKLGEVKWLDDGTVSGGAKEHSDGELRRRR